jgi:hypothetical protein
VRDVRKFVQQIFSLDPVVYNLHGIDPPLRTPSDYRALAKMAFGNHALLPNEQPDQLLYAEEFYLIAVPGSGCGVSTKDWVAIRRRNDRQLAALLLQHERTHAWIKRARWDEYTEADAWLATAEMCLPGTWRKRGLWITDHPYLPKWFLALALEIEAA